MLRIELRWGLGSGAFPHSELLSARESDCIQRAVKGSPKSWTRLRNVGSIEQFWFVAAEGSPMLILS